MSVAPRWKRRADEIAEAIGDELSINGTVSIGNDVNLSVATITALANAITNVLNPLSIAASVWGVQQGDYGVCRATQDPSDQNYWMVYSKTGHQVSYIHYANGTQISPSANLEYWVYFNNNQWQLFADDYARNVSVLSTNTTPVHVQVRNIAGGFTAMGSDISTSMKLSAQPVSIADTVNVKTATAESVAITGTVNATVGSATFPISNPNNITVPVVNSNSVTVPVSLGSVTVPVKATSAGIPQNANGISLYLPVDANHGLTIPVGGGVTSIPVSVGSSTVPVRVVTNTSQGASIFGTGVVVPVSGGIASVPVNNTTGVTVQVSGGISSVPVANTNSVVVPVENTNSVTVPVSGGTSSVPVANTNSVVVPVRTVTGTTNAADGTGAAVVVPVSASGTVIDVKIVEISTTTPFGGVAPTTAFHEAMETALDDATGIDVLSSSIYGVITDGVTWNQGGVWTVTKEDGIILPYQQCNGDDGLAVFGSATNYSSYIGRKVAFVNGSIWQMITDPKSVSVSNQPSVPTANQIAAAMVTNSDHNYRGHVVGSNGSANNNHTVRSLAGTVTYSNFVGGSEISGWWALPSHTSIMGREIVKNPGSSNQWYLVPNGLP